MIGVDIIHSAGSIADADFTRTGLSRLHFLGFVRPDLCDDREGPGRPANRWQVLEERTFRGRRGDP